MEFLSDFDLYRLHTLEIHNPSECNVNLMNTIRLDLLQVPYESRSWESFLLNGRAVIDINYYKTFGTQKPEDHSLDILKVNFLTTNDNKNPTKCELRAFMQKIN